MKQKEYDPVLQAEIDRVSAIMLGDPNDPASPNYKRKLHRPTIHWWSMMLKVALTFGSTAVLGFVLTKLALAGWLIWLICGLWITAVILIHLKRILICIVEIYQHFAPDALRNKCRFEPSCSQYMILSLEKYGLWKGLRKGVNRLARCKVPNGGFDDP